MGNIKVNFELEIIEDGFPPIAIETLNARLRDDGKIELDNTPFFAECVAVGDIISCSKDEHDHNYIFENVITPSGNKSISIIFIHDECKNKIYEYLKEKDCYCEYGEFDGFNMLAVSVDSSNEYNEITAYLDAEESLGKISYAELCI